MSYLNTLPLVWGLKKAPVCNHIELTFDYPAAVAQKLLNDEVDIGLIPVAVMPSLPEAHIVSSYCIGANGQVSSVCIFSDVPIESVTHLYLDYQSRTSVALAEILLREYWKVSPVLLQADTHYIEKIKGTTAGVIIGDRALKLKNAFDYVYDLATIWKKMTGLPFVFAAWVSNKQLSESFAKMFDIATGAGMSHIDEIVANTPFDAYDLQYYYANDIDYTLDDTKKMALNLFLKKLALLSSL